MKKEEERKRKAEKKRAKGKTQESSEPKQPNRAKETGAKNLVPFSKSNAVAPLPSKSKKPESRSG